MGPLIRSFYSNLLRGIDEKVGLSGKLGQKGYFWRLESDLIRLYGKKSLRYLDWLVWKRNPFSVTETFVGLLCNVNSELLSVLVTFVNITNISAVTVDQTLNKGSWEHIQQIIIVTTTFVQATFVLGTFVHISNISAVNGQILKKLFDHDIFGDLIFL